MKENITYGECLSHILQALNLKSSKLAREINIDSSLIYKWLRNERVPSAESPYIDLILKYIGRRLANSSQRDAIIVFLTDNEIELSEASDTCILSNLKLILQNSQGYSIRLHNKMKSRHKLFSTRISSVAGFIENIDIRSDISEDLTDSFEKTNFQDAIENGNLYCGRDNIQLIKGSAAVLCTTLNLLRQSPETPPPDNDTILITFNSDFKLLFGAKEINGIWIQTLYDLLSSG